MSKKRQGILAATFMGDPRVTKAQRIALEEITARDSEARILGLDRKFRPVVEYYAGVPPRLVKNALSRTGVPVKADGVAEWWQPPKPHKWKDVRAAKAAEDPDFEEKVKEEKVHHDLPPKTKAKKRPITDAPQA